MQHFLDEILQQPEAFRNMLSAYDDEAIAEVQTALQGRPLLFTGMGASFHAGEIMAHHFQSAQPVRAQQAVELLNYPAALDPDTVVIYISQSGDSGEVAPILDRLGEQHTVFALTNNRDSALGRRADRTLALHAGRETTVATKTYLNSLALLSLIAGVPRTTLNDCAESITDMLSHVEETITLWRDLFAAHETLYFLGHGPHGITARHVSMMVAEWFKRPSVGMSIGAFRHGFIETIDADAGVVVFAPQGTTRDSALALAYEVAGYGAHVLIVEHGRTRRLTDPAPQTDRHELLAPLIDIMPAQLAVEAAAHAAGLSGFRYIQKVVTRL